MVMAGEKAVMVLAAGHGADTTQRRYPPVKTPTERADGTGSAAAAISHRTPRHPPGLPCPQNPAASRQRVATLARHKSRYGIFHTMTGIATSGRRVATAPQNSQTRPSRQ